MRFIDFFAGIGGFRLGLEMAGHECVGHCEIDKYADRSYRAMHDVKEGEWFADDITRVRPEDLPEAEVYCGGFPCQAFSIAGKRGGFEDTRGTLFFEIMRLAKVRRPKYLFLENVRGLLSHDGGRTFGTILQTMGELGYDAEWQILNSKDYGVPQNRERVFIVGHLRKGSRRQVFPITGADRQTVIQVGNIVDTGNWDNPQRGRVYSPEGISLALNTMQGGGLEPKVIVEPNYGECELKDRCNTLTSSAQNSNQKVLEIKKIAHEGGNHYGGGVFDSSEIAPTLAIAGGGTNNIPKVEVVDEPTLCKLDKPYDEEKKRFTKMKDAKIKDIGADTASTVVARYYKGIGGNNDNMVMHKEIRPVITPDIVNKSQNGRRMKDDGEDMFTLTAQDRHGVAEKKPGESYRIRRLTPRECFRLQGFPDELFEKAAEVNSDSQLYKQAGNSVTVNVIYEIAKRLRDEQSTLHKL